MKDPWDKIRHYSINIDGCIDTAIFVVITVWVMVFIVVTAYSILTRL